MKKKIKKAFTLVELLVVIAILAILATVSIVGYNSFTKKAKVSNDTALVSQLNTLLTADSMVNGNASTPADALKITSEAGYDVEKLTPTTNDYEIVWNQETNQFALLDENDNVVFGEKNSDEYKNWKFVSSSEYKDNVEYSQYLKGTGFTKDSEELIINAGLDVGNNTTITTINYTNTNAKEDVRIRTNGGQLEVNAEKDSVSHYGNASVVKVNEVANNSYHEYGTVDEIKLNKGRVVVEKDSTVGSVMVTATTVADIKVENNGTIGGVAASNDTVASSLNNNVKGVSEDKIVSSAVDNSKFAGGLGTENAPYLISNAEELIKIGDYDSKMKECNSYNFKLLTDIDLDSITISKKTISNYFCGVFDGNEKTIKVSSSLDCLFKDAVDNVLIKDLNYTQNGGDYIRIIGGMVSVKTQPTITYDNVDIYNSHEGEKILISKNVGLYFGWTGISQNTQKYGTFNNENRIKITIKNCDVNADVIGYSYNAIFIGGGLYYTDAIVEDCTYNGNYVGDSVNLVLGNQSPYDSTITISNVINKGNISSTVATPKIARGAYEYDDGKGNTSWDSVGGNGKTLKIIINNCSIGTSNTLVEKYLSVTANGNSKIGCQINTTHASNESVNYYLLTLVGGRRIISSSSEDSSYRLNIKINKDELIETIANFKTGKFITKADMNIVGLNNDDLTNAKCYYIYGEHANDKVYLIEKGGVFYYVCDFEKINDFDTFFNSDNNDKDKHGSVDMNSIELTAYALDNTPVGKSVVRWNNNSWK